MSEKHKFIFVDILSNDVYEAEGRTVTEASNKLHKKNPTLVLQYWGTRAIAEKEKES